MNWKDYLCFDDKPLGRFALWLAEVGKTTEVEIDVSDLDNLTTYCWCCVLWRGVLAGLALGLAVGLAWGFVWGAWL